MVTSRLTRNRGDQNASLTFTDVNGTGVIGYESLTCEYAETSDIPQIVLINIFQTIVSCC